MKKTCIHVLVLLMGENPRLKYESELNPHKAQDPLDIRFQGDIY